MPIEVEAKFRVPESSARAALATAGVALTGPRDQEDTFWDLPGAPLRAAGSALRVRRDGETWELTFKGPRQAGPVKARTEHNLAIQADAAPILRSLGYERGLVVRKQRWMGQLGELTVALDHVAGLGWFVELEAVVQETGRTEAAQAIAAAAKRLGLGPQEPKAYAELIAASK